jgi:hypothetical protein
LFVFLSFSFAVLRSAVLIFFLVLSPFFSCFVPFLIYLDIFNPSLLYFILRVFSSPSIIIFNFACPISFLSFIFSSSYLFSILYMLSFIFLYFIIFVTCRGLFPSFSLCCYRFNFRFSCLLVASLPFAFLSFLISLSALLFFIYAIFFVFLAPSMVSFSIHSLINEDDKWMACSTNEKEERI